MIINHNIAALNTYRMLSANNTNTQKSLEKLSSGLRINKAGDDAAGLAISEKMRAQIRGLEQASRNSQDAISLIQTAEGGLNEVHSILQRMRELANQAASDTNVDVDRTEIQKEINQLTSEINRIGNTTEFNTQKLLKGRNVEVTETARATSTITEGAAGVAAGAVSSVTVNQNSIEAVASTATVQAGRSGATGDVSEVTEATASVKGIASSVTINDIVFTADTTGTTYNDKSIVIQQGSGLGTSSSLDISGDTYTFTIGTDAAGNTLASNRGELLNELTAAIEAWDTANPGSEAHFTVALADENTTAEPAIVDGSGTTGGGVDEVRGVYSFKIETAFKDAGDTITIDGETFTAVWGDADAAKGEFSLDQGSSGKLQGTGDLSKDLSGINAGTSVEITIDGWEFQLNAAALSGTFDGSATAGGVQALIEGAVSTLDSNITLGDVATVSVDDDGNITIKSNSRGASSTVKFGITDGASDTAAIQTAFGLTTGVEDAGQAGGTAAAQAENLADAIQSVLNTRFGSFGSIDTSAGDGTIQLTESSGAATGVKLADPAVSGSGANDILTITNPDGVNLNTVTITANTGAQAEGTTNIGVATGDLTITADDAGTDYNGWEISFVDNVAGLSVTVDTNAKTITFQDDFTNGATADTLQKMQDAINMSLESEGLGRVTLSVDGVFTSTEFGSEKITMADGESTDELAVADDGNGNLTIQLATDTASKNTAEKIQNAVRELTGFENFTFAASGNWNTAARGNITLTNYLTDDVGTLVGGTEEQLGSYTFTVDKAFEVGDYVTILGETFKAVESGGLPSKGEFNVSGGDIEKQADSLRQAIALNANLGARFTGSNSGSSITLVEKTAVGTDLATSDIAVTGTGIAGQYSFAVSEAVEAGGYYIIDGEEIEVTDDSLNIGLDDGTAIMAGDTAAEQAANLVEAVNNNAVLSARYTASVGDDGSVVLTQKAGQESDTAPSVSTRNSDRGDFSASFQIGANNSQSFSINIGDMRSAALKVSGDTASGAVKASDGSTAYYMAISEVTNGTDNTGVEYALDVSTHEKAAAAITVINDAIEAVSAERSKLGAYQNRLEHTINNLGTSAENLTAAESRIRDVDYAEAA